jgi:probable phosphoglycerate mutase
MKPDISTRIVLIRHGHSRSSEERVVLGHGCTGLSDLGRRQAIALRERLERTGELRSATAFYASVMARAHETAELIAPAVGDGRLEIRNDCGLCEQHPGEADGLSFDEYAETYGTIETLLVHDRAAISAPGSESVDAMVSRVGDALQAISDAHPGETVVVACHGGVVACSFEALAGVPVGTLVYYVDNTAITEWLDNGERWRLFRYNDAGHLQTL